MRKTTIFIFSLVLSILLGIPVGVWAQKNPIALVRQGMKKFPASAVERKVVRAAIHSSPVILSGGLKGGPSVKESVKVKTEISARKITASPVKVSLSSSFSIGRRTERIFPGKSVVDAVIFDLDGTLLDSLSAWKHSGSNFLRTQGITPPEGLDEQLSTISLMDGARLLKEQFALPQEPEEILRLTLEPIRRHYFEDIPAKNGVPELLHMLKAQGIKLCVATASDRELTEAALSRLGLLDLFDFVLTCDEVGLGKRSSLIYEDALYQLGTAKSRTLVVEDARYALETAKRAGFLTAGVADPHTPAEDAQKIREQADYYIEYFLGGVFKK